MTSKKKYTVAEILMVIACLIGCSLIVAPKFIDSEYNLPSMGMAINGIGIFIFLFIVTKQKA